jgi:hypothetical protein
MSTGRTEHAPPRRLPEAVLVNRWRRYQFTLLGFDPEEARTLAASPADLALARRLIHGGCPKDTAFAIVR